MKQAETEVVIGGEQPRDRRGRRRLARERRAEMVKEYEGAGAGGARATGRPELDDVRPLVHRARRHQPRTGLDALAPPSGHFYEAPSLFPLQLTKPGWPLTPKRLERIYPLMPTRGLRVPASERFGA